MPVKCKEVLISQNDALTLRITGGTSTIKSHSVDGKIQSLEMPGDYFISVGTVVHSGKTKKIPYPVNKITKTSINSVVTYNLHVAARNKSSLFIMPMLTGKRNLFFYNKLLMNCFIGTPDHPNCIALLYRWSGDPLFLKFEQALKKFRSFKCSYDPSPFHVMFIFEVPHDQQENYNKILEGKYSKITPDYKSQILEFHGFEENGELGQILYKSPKRKARLESALGVDLPKDSELYSVMDLKEETFNYKTYIYEQSN